MGDRPPPQDGRPAEPQSEVSQEDSQLRDTSRERHAVTQDSDRTTFVNQQDVMRQQPRIDTTRVGTMMYPYVPPHGLGQVDPAFNMSPLAGALPEFNPVVHAQRFPGQIPGVREQGHMPQFQAGQNYVSGYNYGHVPGVGSPNSQPQIAYGGQHARTAVAQPGISPIAQHMPQYYYPSSPFSPQGQGHFFPLAGPPFPAYGDRPTSHSSLQGISSNLTGFSSANRAMPGSTHSQPEANVSSTPRGPPRKPKQSGHALWVGNLPAGTSVMSLKDHFSREATKDIESLFLISKSNCAFVNYRSEEACNAAMQRFHDSRFHGVRLVCRLRRPSSSAPTAAGTSPSNPIPSDQSAESLSRTEPGPSETQQEDQTPKGETTQDRDQLKDRYFVVKSLTQQDLDMSVHNGVWATQSHNEEVLNKAFETADNVYLIFSANKSGEYFGYARMTSPISQGTAVPVTPLAPEQTTQEPTVDPRIIPTEATEFAPKGRIIDDSARGTIFWEADGFDDEDEREGESKSVTDKEASSAEEQIGQQTWGKPFKIEWICTSRLPFFRTRGIRNPWNANREVKIARDGTELETKVGSRILQMFQSLSQTLPAQATAGIPPGATVGSSQQYR